MNQAIKIIVFAFSFLLVGLLVGFKIKGGIQSPSTHSSGSAYDKLKSALQFIEKNYVKSTDSHKIVEDALRGVMEELDPHSFYIPTSEMKDMTEQMEGSFDGIGIQFEIINDSIYVVAPLSGGPSEMVGIMAGDKIVKVDGENVASIEISTTDVQKYLKGPRGSEVNVGVFRQGIKDLLYFDIKRDKIPFYSVDYSYMLDEETGFIQVSRFAETTYQEFTQHLAKLKDQGMKNLILDLRKNPGGYMTMAYKMADEFLGDGKTIVSTKGRIAQSVQTYDATAKIGSFEEGALIVLIDYGSASASEIVAGAVQDHDRGIVVGVRSFGKGLVQVQEEFEDGSAIRLVISEYYTPSGRCIQKPYDKSTEDYHKEIYERFSSGELFDQSKIDLPDSLMYTTAGGRTVYGGGGILPDIFVPSDTSMGSSYLGSLIGRNIFRDFAYPYVDQHASIAKKYPSASEFVSKFTVTDALVNQFTRFAAEKGVKYDAQGYQKSELLIRQYLKAFIGRRMYNDDGYYPVYFGTDNVLKKALSFVPIAKELEKTGKLIQPEQ